MNPVSPRSPTRCRLLIRSSPTSNLPRWRGTTRRRSPTPSRSSIFAPATSGSFRTRSAACCPRSGPIVGYAVTAVTKAAPPESGEATPDLLGDYLRYVAAQPGPKISVGQDIDSPPGLGAQFRRGHGVDPQEARLRRPHHQRLPARPGRGRRPRLRPLRPQPLRQPRLRPGSCDFGKPVNIYGVEVAPGTLIHADKHGVCLIPHEIAPRLAEACAEVERVEKPRPGHVEVGRVRPRTVHPDPQDDEGRDEGVIAPRDPGPADRPRVGRFPRHGHCIGISRSL